MIVLPGAAPAYLLASGSLILGSGGGPLVPFIT